MSEYKKHTDKADWRNIYVPNLLEVARELDFLPISKIGRETEVISSMNISEALVLPSTLRLHGQEQHSPVASALLGLHTTRGEHTEDTMKLTANFLTHLSRSSPAFFAKLIKKYGLNTDQIILHCVEYMRLHDAATLAFQGAMHGRVKIGGRPYHEDDALVAAFEGNSAYKPVFDVLFDNRTKSYYKARGLNSKIILQIAKDGINADGDVARMLKSGRDHAPIDWLAYTARDWTELMDVFGINSELSFSDKIFQLLIGLDEFSDALKDRTPFDMSTHPVQKKGIESLLPSTMVKLEVMNGKPSIIYDAETISQLYVVHILLRLYFTGSPWIRGTNDLIFNTYYLQYRNDIDRLVQRLFQFSEQELLMTDLKDVLPIVGLGRDILPYPEAYPTAITGWHYVPSKRDYNNEEIYFKDIAGTTVDMDGEKIPFSRAFPELMQLGTTILQQQRDEPLYVKQ